MPFKKIMKTQPSDVLAARGLMYQDWDALTQCQRECTRRLGMTVQLEQEAYMTQHPEISAMLELFFGKMVQKMKRRSGFLKEGVDFFTRRTEELDEEIRERLGIGMEGPYYQGLSRLMYKDEQLEKDLQDITRKFYPPEPYFELESETSTLATESSAFISIVTSATTLPTPEPVPIPEPTLSEAFLSWVSNIVDKSIFLHVDDQALRYDTAYVEISKAVEEAMEIPVIDIREDIARLFFNAYEMFEMNILEKERIAAEIAWGKRMRKKMKRMLRRQDNFKGWVTPPTPKSEVSSHESYRKPPHRPCECHPQYRYNRYPKDRFGIYLPRPEQFDENNVTATPAVSQQSLSGIDDDNKSLGSKKSMLSKRSLRASTISKKSIQAAVAAHQSKHSAH